MNKSKKAAVPKKSSDQHREDDPCWNGYEQIGLKKKDGREVPNCVPEKKQKSDGARAQQISSTIIWQYIRTHHV